jgi:circadian clock protein KaiB
MAFRNGKGGCGDLSVIQLETDSNPEEGIIELRLYVADRAPNSARARSNLKDICEKNHPERFRVEIVDVISESARAVADLVFVTPTLVKVSPPPRVRIVGTLDARKKVIQAIGLGGG